MIFLCILSYFFIVFVHFFFFFYPKNKMKIAEEAVLFVDNYNLEVLKKFSRQEIDPDGYNREIRKYKGEFGKRILRLYRTHHLKPFKILVNFFKKSNIKENAK